MAIQQLFYETAVPVSFQRHKDWSVKTGNSYSFANKVNSVPVTAIEFAMAAAEYPIVFAGSEGNIMPAIVLGVRDGENLYVGPDGAWQGKYIPAFVRRYPFVFAQDKDGKNLILYVDEKFEGMNQTGRGERLFDSDGAQTQYLKSILNFLQDYQARFQRTKVFCQKLEELKLLQPMQAQFNLNTGEQRTLSGFMTIDREKLKGLSGDVLADLAQKDELECAYLHLASLRHFRGMLERFAPKQQTIGTEAESDASANGEGSSKAEGKKKNGRAHAEATVE
ncbi:SapC family protein [Bradyrhizobium diazoefficiens]|nr:SapC family protein [Bradyrhizobium diazoefficiens]MBR0815177.1 SapC family protein [Bradyrhizobium diazoefficiens]